PHDRHLHPFPTRRSSDLEPLRYLFKDEVREVGAALGLPEEIVWRHPFPGPGLSLRVLGEITEDRLETLRKADAIVMDEVRAAGLDRKSTRLNSSHRTISY